MRGRKPTPPTLKVVQGNPGKRPINDDQVQIEVVIPQPPAHLAPTARAEWDRITVDLRTARLITQLDMAPLAAYCDAWGEYVQAREQIGKPAAEGGGFMVKTPNGYEVQSPWVAIANKAFERMLKVGVEFGLTPSARNRVAANPQLPLFGDDDPMEGFLRAGSRVL